MPATTLRSRVAYAATLKELAAKIDSVERRGVARETAAIKTGLPAPLNQLACGVLHEWFCPADSSPTGELIAPVLPLGHLARQRVESDDGSHAGLVVWIGRPRMWPYPPVLVGSANRLLLHRSLLVEPRTNSDRLWAIDLCLRSHAAAVVIADGSAMTLRHSRRLQLAAEAGGALALLARPRCELSIPSAAATRWRVDSVASPTARPRWRVELVRCKGVQRRSGTEADAFLIVEHDRETGCVRVPANLANRPAETAAPAARRNA